MIEWLQSQNIGFPGLATKSELYMVIKQHKPPKDYIIDNMFSSHGHKVVRLPPYNCDLNPIDWRKEINHIKRL